MRIIIGRRIGKLVIYLVLLFVLAPDWNSKVLAVEFPSERFGAYGPRPNYNLDCGPNGIMTGAMGRFGGWLDQLVVICRTVNTTSGVLGEEYTRGPVGGLGGNRDEIWRCQNGRVVAQISASYGNFVHALSFGCARWIPENRQIEGGLEPSLPLNPFICTSNCWVESFQCPGLRVGKALRGHSGIYIDNFSIICDDWDK
jgi:hypothetical protein